MHTSWLDPGVIPDFEIRGMTKPARESVYKRLAAAVDKEMRPPRPPPPPLAPPPPAAPLPALPPAPAQSPAPAPPLTLALTPTPALPSRDMWAECLRTD